MYRINSSLVNSKGQVTMASSLYTFTVPSTALHKYYNKDKEIKRVFLQISLYN